jgi:hypothetical protein
MNHQLQSDEYFNQTAIARRINTRQRRQLILVIHAMLVLAVTAFIIFDSIQVQQFIRQTWPDIDSWNYLWMNFSGRDRLMVIAAAWAMLPFQYAWVWSRVSAEKLLDVEMREAREYELRRYELERDAGYRLSNDGELFYDDESEYDLKPKRKWER